MEKNIDFFFINMGSSGEEKKRGGGETPRRRAVSPSKAIDESI